MSQAKRIVCLANSRKTSGRCIAGKEFVDGCYGGWIRPVSKRCTEEISEYERQFEDGSLPQILDIITVPLIDHQPHAHQQENYLINDNAHWEKNGSLTWKDLADAVDAVSGELWKNGDSSSNGENDRILERDANILESSLLFIQPNTLTIGVEYSYGKRKVRATFSLNNHTYTLAVTDPRFEEIFLKKENGQYKINASEVYMCISLGEPFGGYCYKLVASIIRKPGSHE